MRNGLRKCMPGICVDWRCWSYNAWRYKFCEFLDRIVTIVDFLVLSALKCVNSHAMSKVCDKKCDNWNYELWLRRSIHPCYVPSEQEALTFANAHKKPLKEWYLQRYLCCWRFVTAITVVPINRRFRWITIWWYYMRRADLFPAPRLCGG